MTTTNKRPSWDEYFLEIMDTVGKRVTCDRGRSCALIAKDKQILTTGYAGSPAGTKHCDEVGHEIHKVISEEGKESSHCIRTVHAEQNAIAQAAKIGTPLLGSTIYSSMFPCYTCAKIIISAGITRVVAQNDYHASVRSKEIFKEAGVKFEIVNNEIKEYKNQ